MFSKGRPLIRAEDVLTRISEVDILSKYLAVTRIPCVIKSPLRNDKKPSFGIYMTDAGHIVWYDFAIGDKGDLFNLLQRLWNCSFSEMLLKIDKDITSDNREATSDTKIIDRKSKSGIVISDKSVIELKCKIRKWEKYDIEYWNSYGISLKWLKFANVYPISHKILIKNGIKYTFKADKYAYAFIEFKEDVVSMKIYQPFNKIGFKWTNNHNSSVIGLWTKIPEYGDKVCICSSVKDALCLYENTGIPSLSLQGEGFRISDTAVRELKKRYKKQYIILDNDSVGIKDSIKLADSTGFMNLVLPAMDKGKDISDAYFYYGKEYLQQTIEKLLENN